MKNTLERLEKITYKQMDFNLHQIQHMLNGLIRGCVFDGNKIDTDKLIEYKLSLIKILDRNEELCKENKELKKELKRVRLLKVFGERIKDYE
tara:strand:- start:27 stop:302 length:276 start_codon:yes stop_codon:yes gene_type:complete